MIVVFVVDTSPSMGEPMKSNKKSIKDLMSPSFDGNTNDGSKIKNNNQSSSLCGSGMSKLDLAKMTVESISKMMERRIHEHNTKIQSLQQQQKPHSYAGFGYCLPDQFLLLTTGRQQQQQQSSSSASSNSVATCGAGGRLIVGFGEYNEKSNVDIQQQQQQQQQQEKHQLLSHMQQNKKHDAFEKELKLLKATTYEKKGGGNIGTFPEDGGGSNGLNIALSSGLQLLSRYRLHHSCTENFGMGRLPSNSNLIPNNNCNNSAGGGSCAVGGAVGGKQSSQAPQGSLTQAGNALQPACLILLTDGECLRRPKIEGGGSLQLQFNLPLREFYREPFRWDQRIFCLGIGPSSDNLHPSLRAFCDVTGGCHASIKDVPNISQVTGLLSKLIAPPIPTQWPLPNPLRLPHLPPIDCGKNETNNLRDGGGLIFANGGPICCFQQFEATATGQVPPLHRAQLLYAPTYQTADDNITSGTSTTKTVQSPSPIWCIPESHFPSKKLDSLPARTAQPVLHFARQYQIVGANTFDPISIMASLHRLDQLVTSNRNLVSGGCNTKQFQQQLQPVLQRDVYLCEWIKNAESNIQQRPRSQRGLEYFPVCVRGAGRPSLTEGSDENVLNIGILHLPHNAQSRSSTLTLLPPDIHILLPLLLKAAEVENRALKKAVEKREKMGLENTELHQTLSTISKNVLLDENWRLEFRAYMFRIPPYYLISLRWCLRQLLPSRAQSLVSIDSIDNIILQCFSRQCLQKIKNGEQLSIENVERLERKEEEYRNNMNDIHEGGIEDVGYGQFDKRSQPSNFLCALRQMPPPWKPGSKRKNVEDEEGLSPTSVVDRFINLPTECLLAYYESRRRWIFGGTGLTTRGLAVEGVSNSGSNVHRYKAKRDIMDESLLSLVGVGASTVEMTPISKMGEFKGRLLFSKQPIVGYGCNDSTVAAATTAADGSPTWSMSDDVLPSGFFDPKTGEFNDNMENRIRTKLMINFGNPYKDKRGNPIVPEEFISQRPPLRKNMSDNAESPQGSPPHDAFATMEDEGEAVFVKTSPTHKTNFEGENNVAEEKDDRTKRQRLNPTRPPPPPPPSTNRPPPPPPPKGKQQSHKPGAVVNKQKPPPPSKPKQGQPPPPSKPKQGQPPPPSKPKQGQPPPPSTANPKQQMASLAQMRQKLVRTSSRDSQSPNTKQSQKPVPPEVQSPNAKPKVTLPPGWISVWSKSQRRWYYFDQKTNKSVWEWPPP